MKKEVDYIQQYEQEEKELDALRASASEQDGKSDHNKFQLIIDMVSLRESQYERVRDEEKWDLWTQVFYDMACRNARIHGGKVILDVDEESLTGSLTYTGHDLIFGTAWNEDIELFAGMIDLSEDIFISNKNGLIEIQFMFHVYDNVKIADYSDRINELESQIYSPEYLKYLHERSTR